MNKFISIAASAAFIVSFAGCSNGDDKPAETVTVTATPTPTVETETIEPPAPIPTEDSGTSDGTIPDDEFADLVRENTSTFGGVPDEDITGLAKSVCDLFDAGGTVDDVFQGAVDNNVDPYDAGFLVGAGVQNYCPEYADLLEDVSAA